MTSSYRGHELEHALERLLARVRRRWRARRTLSGLAVGTVATIAAVLLGCWLLDVFKFEAQVVSVTRIALAAVIVVLAVAFVLRPLVRKAPRNRVAMYLEEREPSLKAAVLSAVEVAGTQSARQGGLGRRVFERALSAADAVEGGRRVDRARLRRSAAAVLVAIVAAAILVQYPPGFVRTGFDFLLAPWRDQAPVAPYSVGVSPGDVTVARGSDLTIEAKLEGFLAPAAELSTRLPGTQEWGARAMLRGRSDTEHEIFLYAVDRSLEYRVSADGVTSETYTIEVQALPEVSRIDLTYQYPAHTGLGTREIEDGGDIESLAGTRVALRIETTEVAQHGELVFDDGERIALERDESGSFGASFEVVRSGRYHIELAPPGAKVVPASPEYLIRALEDQPPVVRFVAPGRDTKVTSVEEPGIEIEATDDFGLNAMELIYSVNGGPEQRLQLAPPAVTGTDTDPGESSRPRSLKAAHRIFLEDFDLSPGDLLSYYARAVDRVAQTQPGRTDTEIESPATSRDAVTDLYFMEVRPFARNFRESQGGGGGQPGGQDDAGALSNRQREVVVSIFKLIRREEDSDESPPDATYRADLETVSSSEARILERVEAIIRRLGERQQVREDDSYRVVAEELPQARDAIVLASNALEAEDTKTALGHAQKA
ncbi:MAG: hypothetical protein ACR2RL_23075, partial [Gammaproteobacteria bacterium]